MSDTRVVPESPDFDVDVAAIPGGSRVTARGELDIAVADRFREVLEGELAHGDVVLDLSGLRFMDSSGIAAMNAVLRQPTTGRLLVAPELHDHVRQVLELTGMISALAFVTSEEHPEPG